VQAHKLSSTSLSRHQREMVLMPSSIMQLSMLGQQRLVQFMSHQSLPYQRLHSFNKSLPAIGDRFLSVRVHQAVIFAENETNTFLKAPPELLYALLSRKPSRSQNTPVGSHARVFCDLDGLRDKSEYSRNGLRGGHRAGI